MQTFMMVVDIRWDVLLAFLCSSKCLFNYCNYLSFLYIGKSILSTKNKYTKTTKNMVGRPRLPAIASLQMSRYAYRFCQKNIFHQVQLRVFLEGNEVERLCSILADCPNKTPRQMGRRRQTYAATHFISSPQTDTEVSTLLLEVVDVLGG